MDQNKINMFLATNAKFFTAAQLADLRNRITELDDSLLMYTSQLKDPTTALILSIFTGGLGIDRFYIGDTGLGIGKLLTGGGCGIWSLRLVPHHGRYAQQELPNHDERHYDAWPSLSHHLTSYHAKCVLTPAQSHFVR